MGQNSCQPEGLQPESALASLLVLAIERLLPSSGALPSPILAATHTCFIMLGTLSPPAHGASTRVKIAVSPRRIHQTCKGQPTMQSLMKQSPLGVYVEHCKKGELAYQVCTDDNTPVFFPRAVAPKSGSTNLEWRVSKGLGTVYSTTVVHAAKDQPPHNVA